MDQIMTGKFIAELRKEKGLTQRALADALLISDKTVSKWETGKGMPEISLMMPLCEQLGITVNELLSGERLNDSDYRKKAEENMMELIREKAQSKKKITIAVAVTVTTLAAAFAMFMVADLQHLDAWANTLLITLGLICLFSGVFIACVLDADAGTYECKNCHHRFVPGLMPYIWGIHTLTTRRLKCPECGKTTWCQKRLTH